MTLAEFDLLMDEAGFAYSPLVLVCLDRAGDLAQKAKNEALSDFNRDDEEIREMHAKRIREAYGAAYAQQLDALEFAESEKRFGFVTSAKLMQYMPLADEKFIRTVCARWLKYLHKIGSIVPIQEVIQND